jgi:large subunit ribosomal protein L15
MFTLHNLESVTKKRKRIGRGGSRGGQSGRGSKGQNARSGGGVRPGFEGGQMPLHRRLPKRGFTNAPHAKFVVAINLARLEVLDDGMEVTKQLLIDRKMIKAQKSKSEFTLKILGTGDLTKKLVIYADAFSKSASESITKAGGEAHLIGER